MQHFSSLHTASAKNAWLPIGSFDGLHAGHQQIIQQITAGAHEEGAPAVVLTFEPHPAEVLRGPLKGFYLLDPEEKIDIFASLGVDVLVSHPFDANLRNTTAEVFIQWVYERLHIQQLWIGHDFALGHDRQGNFDALRRFGAQMGFSVHQVLPVRVDGEVVSSTGGQRLPSVTNIGLRPTFEDGTPAPIVETHILEYEGSEFYGQPLKLEFVSRLRGEHKFAGVDELVHQIHQDIEQARSALT